MRTMMVFCCIAVMTGMNDASAGNVEVEVRGGSLFVQGSNAPDQIAVSEQESTAIVVGMGGTTVNGNAAAQLEGWTGGLFAYMNDGNDVLDLQDISVAGHCHLDLGRGSDTLRGNRSLSIELPTALEPGSDAIASALPTSADGFNEFQQALIVLAGQGNDEVILDSFSVGWRLVVNLGGGNDLFEIAGGDEANLVRDSMVIIPGSGSDFTDMQNISIVNDLVFDDFSGTGGLATRDTMVGRNAFIYATPQDDLLEMRLTFVMGLLQIFADGGEDEVIVSADADDIDVFGGNGDDLLVIANSEASRIHTFGENGADVVRIVRTQCPTIRSFGGLSNDRFLFRETIATLVEVFGDGNFDRFIDGGDNAIDDLNLFSIERR